MLRTIVGWAIAIMLIVFFVKHGGEVGGWVHEAWSSISAFADQATK